jgi:hypothetical protein
VDVEKPFHNLAPVVCILQYLAIGDVVRRNANAALQTDRPRNEMTAH